MYQTMEIYMARKKQVPGHYNPDSNRIFDRDVGDDSLGDSRLNKLHTNRTNPPPPPHPREPERRNCPHPWHSRFLRHNVRLLNEPICVMATETTDPEQDDWWPSRTSNEPLKKPGRSLDTIQRSDYQHSAPARGNTRHSSNPFTAPSRGILPVNEPKRPEDPGSILLESISYKHGFNSRLEKSEPIRGKLHGSFVYDDVIETDKGKVVVTPWNRKHLHRCVTVPVTKQDQTIIAAAPSDQKNKETGNSQEGEKQKEPKSDVQEPKIEKSTTPKEPEKELTVEIKEEKEANVTKTASKEEPAKKAEVIPPIDGLPAPTGA